MTIFCENIDQSFCTFFYLFTNSREVCMCTYIVHQLSYWNLKKCKFFWNLFFPKLEQIMKCTLLYIPYQYVVSAIGRVVLFRNSTLHWKIVDYCLFFMLYNKMNDSVSLWTETSREYGNAVSYGCSLSLMPYLTFVMIGIYTAINVNNVSYTYL